MTHPTTARTVATASVRILTATTATLLLVAGSAAAAGSGDAADEVLLARPPSAATGQGVIATVDGVVADVVPRTASADGALEQAGESDFVLAGDVYFDTGSAALLPRATADLRTVADQVQESGVTALLVVGHTDSVGSTSDNQALSESRAASVVAALQPLLPGVTLVAEGRGESEPVADERTSDGEDDPAGRALNRRVTITPAG